MPVKFDEYSEADDPDLPVEPGSNGHAILLFLSRHPEMGFTPTEIHEHVDIPMGSIGPTLKRLEERELVRHKGSYWAIGEDDRLASYDALLHSMESFPEEDAEWSDVAWEEEGASEEEMAAWRARKQGEDDSGA